MTHTEWLIALNALQTPHTLDSPARAAMTADEYAKYLMVSGERFKDLRLPDRIPTEAQRAAADPQWDTVDYNEVTPAERRGDFRAGQNQYF